MKNTYEQFLDCVESTHFATKAIQYNNDQMWKLLKKQKKNLTAKEYRVLKMKTYEHKNLQEMGKELGVTRERVRQLLALAMESWRKNPAD